MYQLHYICSRSLSVQHVNMSVSRRVLSNSASADWIGALNFDLFGWLERNLLVQTSFSPHLCSMFCLALSRRAKDLSNPTLKRIACFTSWNLPPSKIVSTYCYVQLAFLIFDDNVFILEPMSFFCLYCKTNALSVIYMQIFVCWWCQIMYTLLLSSVNRCFDFTFTNKQ